MDQQQLEAQLIENEITLACAQHNADASKLGDVLRKEAIVVEHGGKPVVSIKVDDTSGLPHLSPAFSGDVPLSLTERLKELRDSGRYPDAFKRPEPEPQVKGERLIDGVWTPEEFLRLSPSEQLTIAKRIDPDGRRKKVEPSRREALPALKSLLAHDKKSRGTKGK